MGCRGTWFTYLGRMAPPAGLRFICLHKMADKLFTCKYKLRAWETWHAFLELPAVPILCASHSKKQPGLSLEFSAKGTVLTSQVHFNPKFLSATSRIHGTILGDCMSSKKESINISERVINSHVSNFYLFQEKEVGVPLSETLELKLRPGKHQPIQFPLSVFCQSQMKLLEENDFISSLKT